MKCSADPTCNCPPITFPPCPPECPSDIPSKDASSKYFQEIGAEMMCNQLIIRMEKDKNSKGRKSRGQWDPPCDCDMVEIRRPTNKEGAKIINGSNENRILFRIHSKGHLPGRDDPNYKPQAIAYQMGSCDGGKSVDDARKTFTVYPQYGSPGCQEVYTDRTTEGDENIFFLRIKKKQEAQEQKRRKIELELRTPRPSTPPPIPSLSKTSVKSTSKLKISSTKLSKKKKKGKGKGKGKGKRKGKKK